jgi:hypothetical protein
VIRAGSLVVGLCLSCHPPPPGGGAPQAAADVAIRVNKLGYQPSAPKVAVVCA